MQIPAAMNEPTMITIQRSRETKFCFPSKIFTIPWMLVVEQKLENSLWIIFKWDIFKLKFSAFLLTIWVLCEKKRSYSWSFNVVQTLIWVKNLCNHFWKGVDIFVHFLNTMYILFRIEQHISFRLILLTQPTLKKCLITLFHVKLLMKKSYF